MVPSHLVVLGSLPLVDELLGGLIWVAVKELKQSDHNGYIGFRV